MKKSTLLKFMNLWPPYLGAGIRVTYLAPDFTSVDVEMKLRFWNQNYVGTQFGGSLYSMTDPFFMLILIENLGSNYVVWDKSATIRFKSPGRGKVRAHFEISKEEILKIKTQVNQDGKVEPHFKTQVLDEFGNIVAEVEKVLSVKKKLISPAS